LNSEKVTAKVHPKDEPVTKHLEASQGHWGLQRRSSWCSSSLLRVV
jgi:hypothetical protein